MFFPGYRNPEHQDTPLPMTAFGPSNIAPRSDPTNQMPEAKPVLQLKHEAKPILSNR